MHVFSAGTNVPVGSGTFVPVKNDHRGNQRPDLVRSLIFNCLTFIESSFQELFNEVLQSKIEPRTRSGRRFLQRSFTGYKSTRQIHHYTNYAKNYVMTLSVARFLTVRPHWNALETSFLTSSGNQKSNHGQGREDDFCEVHMDMYLAGTFVPGKWPLQKSTSWPCP